MCVCVCVCVCVCETIRSFGDIYIRKVNIAEAEENQSNLLNNIVECNNKCRPRSKIGNDKKIIMKVHVLFMRADN